MGSLAGCAALASGPPDVDPNTGLGQNPASALDSVPVFLAGEPSALPDVPMRVDSLGDARVALATPDAPLPPLAEAFRNDTTVAFAGNNAPGALASLLAFVSDGFHYGIETVVGKSVKTTVAVPNRDTVDTYQFVHESGWDDPTLDPVGWTLDGRLPDCETFVPESASDEQYARVGSAWLVGRLASGETYAARTVGRRHTSPDARRLRLRTTVHAAANEGFAIDEARRVADFPNDESLLDSFPNPHERDGVAVANYSDLIENRLEVSISPATDRTERGLTGCCGLTTGGAYAYDHRTRWVYTNNGLVGSKSHYGGGTGRGEWHIRT